VPSVVDAPGGSSGVLNAAVPLIVASFVPSYALLSALRPNTVNAFGLIVPAV